MEESVVVAAAVAAAAAANGRMVKEEQVLEEIWGFREFKSEQKQVIQRILHGKNNDNGGNGNDDHDGNGNNGGNDVFVLWATGAGKSLNYLFPAFYWEKQRKLLMVNHSTGNERKRKVVVVVSPLISLMTDQVRSINRLYGKEVAVFLGSAQVDGNLNVDQLAFSGHFPIVYLSPEKFNSSIPSLIYLHQNVHKNDACIGLFAIDEAHCISEWGSAFRPDYRLLSAIREENSPLKNIPIIALTATATFHIEKEIISVLKLGKNNNNNNNNNNNSNNSNDGLLVSRLSVDRSNLVINVYRKMSTTGHSFDEQLRPTLDAIVKECERSKAMNNGICTIPSTIIYCQAQANTEKMRERISSILAKYGAVVECYHGSLEQNERLKVHTNFLTGVCHIVAATIAFGMGIDKPDIRRIVHFGAPKTMVDYYQQIGRAGRDGLESYCDLYFSDADINSYKSDFYLKGLTEKAKEATLESMKALKDYCEETHRCRRVMIMKYFDEKPTFNTCQSSFCDNCLRLRHQSFSNNNNNNNNNIAVDVTLDMTLEAIAICDTLIQFKHNTTLTNAISTLFGKVPTNIVITSTKIGLALKDKRISYGLPPFAVDRSKDFFTELFHLLKNEGYIESHESKFTNAGGREIVYFTFSLTSKGMDLLSSNARFVSEYTRNMKAELDIIEEKRKALELSREKMMNEKKQELKSSGCDVSMISANELITGVGENIQAMNLWHNLLKRFANTGSSSTTTVVDDGNDSNNNNEDNMNMNKNSERQNELWQLRNTLTNWRQTKANELKIAPPNILSEANLYRICVKRPTSVEQLKLMDIRGDGLDEIAKLISDWISQFPFWNVATSNNNNDNNKAGVDDGDDGKRTIEIPKGNYQPKQPWKHAPTLTALLPFKTGKNAGRPREHAHVKAHNLFHVNQLSLSQAIFEYNSDSTIKVSTFISYLMKALLYGLPINFERLQKEGYFPTAREWESMEIALRSSGWDDEKIEEESNMELPKMFDILNAIPSSGLPPLGALAGDGQDTRKLLYGSGGENESENQLFHRWVICFYIITACKRMRVPVMIKVNDEFGFSQDDEDILNIAFDDVEDKLKQKRLANHDDDNDDDNVDDDNNNVKKWKGNGDDDE